MINKLKALSDIDARGKRVLVRIDINSDIRNGKLIPSERLTSSLETIKELKKKKAKIVLLAHQGRPDTKFHDFTSLKQHANYLNKYIKIKFIDDVIGIKAIKAIATMKESDIILLDNVRFVKDELNYKKNKPNKLIMQLAPLFDFYVNDAFSASHREHASIVGFPRVLKSAIGRSFEKELKNVSKLNISNALFVLGGSKPEDNMLLASKRKNRVLASGLFGPFCLMAEGYNLGKENKIMKPEFNLLPKLKREMNHIIAPIDLAIEQKGKRKDLILRDFPVNNEILDLGRNTIKLYTSYIKHAPAVFFKGLAGLCNKPEFSEGTKALLLTASKSKFSVISGGHTLTMIEKFKIPKSSFNYVSTSGGALMHFLANGTLVGIKALKN